MVERKLSIYQYFEALQIEWLVADLRCRIFKSQKDKDYWNKVKEGKRVKIESIGNKNKIPTIFNDNELKNDLINRIYNDYSYPDFHYKDEENRNSQGYWDLLNYYSKGSEVRYEDMGEVKVGRVVEYTPFSEQIRIQCIKTNEIQTVLVNKVIRIL